MHRTEDLDKLLATQAVAPSSKQKDSPSTEKEEDFPDEGEELLMYQDMLDALSLLYDSLTLLEYHAQLGRPTAADRAGLADKASEINDFLDSVEDIYINTSEEGK